MKLSEAMETLTHRQIPLAITKDHDFYNAITLSIQALQRIQIARLRSPNSILAPLPGESAEEELK